MAREQREAIRPRLLQRFGAGSLEWARWLTQRTDAIRSQAGDLANRAARAADAQDTLGSAQPLCAHAMVARFTASQ